MKLTSIRIVLTTIAILTLGVNVPAETYTAIMSGENSEAFTFINNNTAYSEACRSAFRLMSITIPIDADRGSERMPIKKPAFSER